MRKLILLTALFLSLSGFGQNRADFPVDYFDAPLDIPLYLAGNFGEIRSNHFHAGIDLKTQQIEGLDVKAAAKGYVSRVKTSLY
jgi:murein DD-endopeptidase MepM/ murein hydrolase activator NlpD